MDSMDPMDPMDSMDDDFEIEVTDLNTGAPARHPLAEKLQGAPIAPGDDDDLDDNWQPPRSTAPLSRHRLRAAIVTGVIALAVVLVILINPTAKSSLYTVFRFPTPAPSPTPVPGANMIFLAHGAPWGSVTLDGKRQANTNLGMLSAWVTLSPGRHTLAVNQAPFPAVHCVVSYPAAKDDTCPLTSPFDNQYLQFDPATIPRGSRFIDLGARFSLLPQADQDALVAAAEASLQPASTSVTLQPGDHFLRDDGVVDVARAPLLATYIPTMLDPASTVASDSQSCVSFCDITGLTIGGNATWNMRVTLLGSWRVATLDGRVIVEHAAMFPGDPIYEGMPATMIVQLGVLWTGKWQINEYDQFGYGWSPICQIAEQMVGTWLSAENLNNNTSMAIQTGRRPEDGCVINMTMGDPTQSAPLYLYYRLGVLLAANDAAHQTLPKLPFASSDERALASQILGGWYNP